jgi:hypothetical protein
LRVPFKSLEGYQTGRKRKGRAVRPALSGMWFVVPGSGHGVAQDAAVLAALEDALRLALKLAHPLA